MIISRYFKIGLLLCCIARGVGVIAFDRGYSYFEYRYYCDIQSSVRITISLKPSTTDSDKCLAYMKTLDSNISYYVEQSKIAQDNIAQSQFVEYRESYLSQTQTKMLQSRVLRSQMTRAMDKFEAELFQKTMLYINYRLKSTRTSLESYVQLRETAMLNATQAGASEELQKINTKYLKDKRKLDAINHIAASQNFNELMPFYTMYQQGKFD